MRNLNNQTVAVLKQIAKGRQILSWWSMNKTDLINALTIIKKIPNQSKHEDIEEATEEFIKNGGKITKCKDGRAWKEKPPTMKSALLTGKKRRTCKTNKSPKKKPTPKRNNPEVVTLKQICDGMGVSSYKVRKHLRSINLSKPGKQWAWGKDQAGEIDKIKKIIKEI